MAKASIHEMIRNLARQGISVILISDEIPESLPTVIESYYACRENKN